MDNYGHIPRSNVASWGNGHARKTADSQTAYYLELGAGTLSINRILGEAGELYSGSILGVTILAPDTAGGTSITLTDSNDAASVTNKRRYTVAVGSVAKSAYVPLHVRFTEGVCIQSSAVTTSLAVLVHFGGVVKQSGGWDGTGAQP